MFNHLRRLDELQILTLSMALSAQWVLEVGPSIGHTLRKLEFSSGQYFGSTIILEPTQFLRDMVALEEISFLCREIRFRDHREPWSDDMNGLKKLRAIKCSEVDSSVLDALAFYP